MELRQIGQELFNESPYSLMLQGLFGVESTTFYPITKEEDREYRGC